MTDPEGKESAPPEPIAESGEKQVEPNSEEHQRVNSQDVPMRQETVEFQAFSGPIPTPEAFGMYDQVLPGAADRILRMAETEQQIRSEAQKGSITNDRKRINASLIVNLTVLAIAGLAVYFGQSIVAIPLGLAGTVVIFLKLFFRHSDEGK